MSSQDQLPTVLPALPSLERLCGCCVCNLSRLVVFISGNTCLLGVPLVTVPSLLKLILIIGWIAHLPEDYLFLSYFRARVHGNFNTCLRASMLGNFRKGATEAGLVIFGFILFVFFENFIQYILKIFTLLPAPLRSTPPSLPIWIYLLFLENAHQVQFRLSLCYF